MEARLSKQKHEELNRLRNLYNRKVEIYDESQVGVFETIGNPTPKNDSDASNVIAKAKFIVLNTIIGGKQFGNR